MEVKDMKEGTKMTGAFENNKSARIGGVIVFTYEGARNAYKNFVRRASDWEKYGADGLYAISDEMLKMFDLGFSPDECERLEIEAMK